MRRGRGALGCGVEEGGEAEARAGEIGVRGAFGTLAAIAALIATPANASDCSDAVNKYNSALSEVTYRLKRYASCVSVSAGKDDCSTEFRRVKYAQDEFAALCSSCTKECGA